VNPHIFEDALREKAAKASYGGSLLAKESDRVFALLAAEYMRGLMAS